MIKTTVKSWHMVQPAAATTPRHDIWVSNPDLLVRRGHATCVYFYRPTGSGSPDFCSMDVLKDALSKVLVPFYPFAGRLKKDPHGRIEINCNGEGAVLVEVVTDFALDYFGDFKSTMELQKLIPEVNCSSQDISSYPLLLLQVTFFKCGGVSLGVATHHIVADGYSGFNFIKTWSEVVRGMDISLPPYLDRSLLRARDPPTPKFQHIEYEPPPTLNIKNGKINGNHSDCSVSVAMFTITKEQLDNLKAKAIENGYKVKYTSYELLSAHVWRCVSKARNLTEDQESKIYINTNGRSRLRPPLPPGYFGNVVFIATPMALVGDIISKPVYHAASIIHEALIRMDDEYLRSALDYLELQPKDLDALARGAHTFRAPNMCITSWCGFPIQDADFGWGKPIFLRPAGGGHEGYSYILPSPTNDGSLSVALGLQADHMDSFRKLIYEF